MKKKYLEKNFLYQKILFLYSQKVKHHLLEIKNGV